MAFEIESGIAVPPKPVRGGKYPFDKMKVGDSFVVEMAPLKSWASLFATITSVQKKLNIQLTTRLIEPGKRRIWRTA